MIFTCFSEVIKMCSKGTSINCSSGLPLSKGWEASCPGWFILPPAQDLGQAVSSVNSYCTIILKCEHYFSKTDMFTSNFQFGYPCPRGGGGASCPGWFILPPHTHTQDLGQTVSSVNSYCTMILEYLVLKDVNIISVKLRCLHLMFSSVILVQGWGGGGGRGGGVAAVQVGLSWPPTQDLGQEV